MQFGSLEERRQETVRYLHEYMRRMPVAMGSAKSLAALQGQGAELADQMEKLAHQDPTLALRMLYLASRSTGLTTTNQPATIAASLARAGTDSILSGIRDLGRGPLLIQENREFEDLWLHSVQVATISKFLAPHVKAARILGEEAYLAGLLHDTGRFVLLVASPDKAHRVNLAEWENGEQLLDLETEITGFNHTLLGWVACRSWRFPEAIAQVNRHHHHSLSSNLQRESLHIRTLVQLIDLADRLCLHIVGMSSTNRENLKAAIATDKTLQPLMTHIGLKIDLILEALSKGVEVGNRKDAMLWQMGA
jgi:HD-like signal output (HDOD) protein